MSNKKINIVLVEDDRLQSEATAFLLKMEGYDVTTIDNGRDALEYLLHNENVDLVVMDNHLPYMDGTEIISELRKRGLHHYIIFASVDDDIRLVIKAMREGAMDFVLKTAINFKDELLRVVKKVNGIRLQQEQQNELEKQIHISEENYRKLFNDIDDFLIILNGKGQILQVNSVVIKKSGYTSEELSGKHVSFIHPPENQNEVKYIVEQMFAGTIQNSFAGTSQL